ncbi:BQ2448_176 [Microbotryum intermedium]|uniref:U6 snRNA-associated Sm-like protein LSm1 n=1 Tax=Microbotryum intermedium TaxID=269621 RepID=A0A238F4T9_9BASI|nr:BQ2448_176 [Microbotryum intermedium]
MRAKHAQYWSFIEPAIGVDHTLDPLSNLVFTTSGALIDLVDKKILVHLRDGRRLIGVLRSYDQYANLVLTQTIERLFHPPSKTFAQTERGVFLIRGENVVLLGEVDLDTEDAAIEKLQLQPWEQLAALLEQDKQQKEQHARIKERVLHQNKGFGEEGGEGDAY